MKRIFAGLLAVLMCVSLWGCEKPEPTEPKCDHQFSNWMVKSKASCSKEGREERICNICYETEKLLYDKTSRDNAIKGLETVRDLLSDKFSAEEVANCILEVL